MHCWLDKDEERFSIALGTVSHRARAKSTATPAIFPAELLLP